MKPTHKKSPRWAIALGLVVVLLIAARAALPWAIKSYVNSTLDSIPGYAGHVEDVDVALLRGAYRLQGLQFVKREGEVKEPLFSAETIDFSLDWRALLDRRLVSRIRLEEPKLQFIQRKTAEESQTSVDKSWQSKVKELIPLEINRFTIEDGLVRYKDETGDPKMNIYLSKLNVVATNLSNTKGSEARLPSSLDADAILLNSGKMSAKGKLNILSEPMQADLNASIRGLQLKELNNFAKAYGNFDFERGTFDLTAEIAASKSKYSGYVKTIAKNVDVVDIKKEIKEGESGARLVWEGLVGGLMELFQNQKREQFAARIPISGSREKVDVHSWAAIGSILKNGFVQAMSPAFEESVEFKDARGPASEKK